MTGISALIPTYYRYADLYNIVESLNHQTTTPNEIVVVDQTPLEDRPENYDDWIQENKIILIDQFKPSQPISRNVAALKAKHDLLLLLDDDIEIRDNFVESHLEIMKREKVDAVSGGTTTKNSLPDEFPWRSESLDPVRFLSAAPNYTYEGMMMGISSGNCLIKRDLFLNSGGFDDECPRMVDFEFGYRLFRSGAKLFFSSLPFAKHLRSMGGTRHNVKKDYRAMAPIYIYMKHYPGWSFQQYILRHIRLRVLKKKYIITPWKILHELKALRDMILESSQRLSHFKSIRIDNPIQKYKNMGIGGNCHPMMTEIEISFIKNLLRLIGSGVNVLEYGSGFSTIFYTQYLESLRYQYTWNSVEHDKKWYNDVQDKLDAYKLSGAKLNFVDFDDADPRKDDIIADIKNRYVEMISTISGKIDIVIIDGRFRSRVYKYAMENTHDDTVIIVMDSEREYYQKKYIDNYKLHYTGFAVWYPNDDYSQKGKYIQVTCKNNILWKKVVKLLSTEN